MKKILLAFLLACFLFACKEESAISPKTDVTFQFSDFNWQVEPLGKAASSTSNTYVTDDTLSHYADYFYYRAYNSAGQKVSEKSQTAASADFGVIKDNLNPGTYTIVFTACRKSLGFSNYGFSSDHFFTNTGSCWDDTFYKSMVVNVGTESSSHPVKLNRVVGALEVKLLDVIPANAAKLILTVELENGVYNMSAGTSAATGTKTKEFILTNDDRGRTGRQFMMHILNVSRPLRITLKSLDSSGATLASKSVDGVSFYQNRKTVLEGNLWASSQFQVRVDATWGAAVTPIKF